MSDDPKCVAGCVPFYGGEKRHHTDCPYYPESLTKLNADRIEELEAKLAMAVKALQFYGKLICQKHECPWHMLSDDFGEKARAALAELGDRDMCKNFTELREGEG